MSLSCHVRLYAYHFWLAKDRNQPICHCQLNTHTMNNCKIGTVVKVSTALTSLLNPIDTARHRYGTYFFALPWEYKHSD